MSSKPDDTEQVGALISEIWMLVDYVAGSSTQGLDSLHVADPSNPGVNLTPVQLLREVSDIEGWIRTHPPTPYQRASLQIVRDALNLLVRPASGLTVAYTAMVAGPFRKAGTGRFALAQGAYSNLGGRAMRHRWFQMALLFGAVLITGLAAWESAKVAFGKGLLQSLDVLRTQQVSLEAEKLRYTLSVKPSDQALTPLPPVASLTPVASTAEPPLTAFRVCDRALVMLAQRQGMDIQEYVKQQEQTKNQPNPRMLFYASPQEADICGRDDILRTNMGIVHGDIGKYMTNWPSMVGSGFALTRDIVVAVGSWFGKLFNANAAPVDRTDGQDDVEFRVAPVLLIWGNFVLPIIFSFLGSCIFVMLDHYNKIHNSLLQPRDFALAPVRLALGLVVGACVGLFFSSNGPGTQTTAIPSTSALIASLTLTASGVAFLAGFGVETVFSMLENLTTRMFSLTPQKDGR